MSLTKLLLNALVLTLLCAPSPTLADPPEGQEAAARKVAESWLALVDSAKYGESWDAAASAFKSRITREKWESLVGSVRGGFGAFQSREFVSSKYTKELPGAPDGDYVVIQFRATYENKKSSVETVTPMLDPDGEWRVSGYRIQ